MKKLLMTISLFAVVASSVYAYKADTVDVSAYPNSNMLISAEEAIKLIGSKKNVMFVSGDSVDSYPNQHIKGSVEMGAHHLHHSNIMGEMHCAPLFQCIEEAEHHIGEKGIDNNTLVIAYDDYRGPNATGVYSFFKSYGHDNVKILMGGFKAIRALDPAQKQYDALKKQAKKAGKPSKKAKKKLGEYKKSVKRLEKAKADKDAKKIKKYQKKVDKGELSAAEKTKLENIIAQSDAKVKTIKAKMAKVEKKLLVVKGEEVVTHKKYHINPKKVSYKAIASKQDVLHAVKDIQKKGKRSKYVIVDARGMIEIIGERKMDNVARGGHIPGSTFMEWKHLSDDKRGVAFKTAAELKKVFKKFGITKDKTIYAYCHVGAGRGSEVVSALEIMGYKNAKVYTGSWDEWGNDMMLPIKR